MRQLRRNYDQELFDNALALQYYEKYHSTGDIAYRNSFVELCIPLIKAIALEFDTDMTDDLRQDAAIKVIELTDEGVYKTDRGNLYSFLSTTIKNYMTDRIRAENRKPSSEGFDTVTESSYVGEIEGVVESVELKELQWYFPQRFYTFPEEVADDIICFLFNNIKTNMTSKDVKRTKTTLSVYYDIPYRQAHIIYHAVEIYIRACCLDKAKPARALKVAKDEKYYWSFFPELAMFISTPAIETLMLVFDKITIRF